MIFIKYTEIFLIVFFSTILGNLYSRKYDKRVKELEEIKKASSMFKSKIQFTYKPISEVFKEIEKRSAPNIGKIFSDACKYMEKYDAEEAWIESVNENKDKTNLLQTDIDVILGLSKMLGATDLEGQINSIKLINDFLENQISEAIIDKNKNEKMLKKLGTSIGLAIAIILI